MIAKSAQDQRQPIEALPAQPSFHWQRGMPSPSGRFGGQFTLQVVDLRDVAIECRGMQRDNLSRGLGRKRGFELVFFGFQFPDARAVALRVDLAFDHQRHCCG